MRRKAGFAFASYGPKKMDNRARTLSTFYLSTFLPPIFAPKTQFRVFRPPSLPLVATTAKIPYITSA